MIADIRTQNMIIVATIIVSMVAASSIIVNVNYYVGSYSLLNNLDIRLTSIILTDFDPTNTTINPSLCLIFNFKETGTEVGDVTLAYLTAVVSLNGATFDYVSFNKKITPETGQLSAQYNTNFTLGATLQDDLDKELLYLAQGTGNWTFEVELRVFYIMFKSRVQSVLILMFEYEGYVKG